MNKITAEFIEADSLLQDFVKDNDKFIERFAALYDCMSNFIDVAGLNEKVKINKLALGYALVDYFEDVRRLKVFHNIEHINSEKIVAYTSYWLLQRKPLQLLVEDKNIVFVNERFILAYISDFISRKEKDNVLIRSERGMESFVETLFYFLKYRVVNANMIELAIISFFAGQIYQETDKDLSSIFEKYAKKNV